MNGGFLKLSAYLSKPRRQIGWNVTKTCSIQLAAMVEGHVTAPTALFSRLEVGVNDLILKFRAATFIVVSLGKPVKLVLEHLMHMRAFSFGVGSTAFPATSFGIYQLILIRMLACIVGLKIRHCENKSASVKHTLQPYQQPSLPRLITGQSFSPHTVAQLQWFSLF
jgi:hypothetical protein